MVRETKLGIVISCSFLGLLGVVVTSKLREKPAATTQAQEAEPDTRTAAAPSPAVKETPTPTVKLTSEVTPRSLAHEPARSVPHTC